MTAQPKRRGHDIIKGPKPADLTVRRLTILALAINWKTAKTLGLPIRQSILIQGHEGIG